MEKLKNIQAYVNETGITVDDMKGMVIRTSLDFGCRVAHMDNDELQQTENMFLALFTLNELIDMVE